MSCLIPNTLNNQYRLYHATPHLHVVVDGGGVVVDGISGARVGPLPTVENTIKYASECTKHYIPQCT